MRNAIWVAVRAGERALERAGERALERAGERAIERAGWLQLEPQAVNQPVAIPWHVAHVSASVSTRSQL